MNLTLFKVSSSIGDDEDFSSEDLDEVEESLNPNNSLLSLSHLKRHPTSHEHKNQSSSLATDRRSLRSDRSHKLHKSDSSEVLIQSPTRTTQFDSGIP